MLIVIRGWVSRNNPKWNNHWETFEMLLRRKLLRIEFEFRGERGRELSAALDINWSSTISTVLFIFWLMHLESVRSYGYLWQCDIRDYFGNATHARSYYLPTSVTHIDIGILIYVYVDRRPMCTWLTYCINQVLTGEITVLFVRVSIPDSYTFYW